MAPVFSAGSANDAGMQLGPVSAEQLTALLDMMHEFNALEDIPWSREDAAPAVQRLLGSPELGVIVHILEAGVVRGYLVLTWDLISSGTGAMLS
jgi:hypothetical protein